MLKNYMAFMKIMDKGNIMDDIIFRGWSEEYLKWVYGFLLGFRKLTSEEGIYITWSDGKGTYTEKVHPDSIGIYINKDDKNGKKIFCRCNGAKYGSDKIKTVYECGIESVGIVKYGEIFNTIQSYYDITNIGFDVTEGELISCPQEKSDCEVISNQWEEFLNEKHSN